MPNEKNDISKVGSSGNGSGPASDLFRVNSAEQESGAGNGNAPVPEVLVMMSTYNGARYLKEQLDSIENQRGVHVKLFARDDGSADSTLEHLEDYCALHGNLEAEVIAGKNVGIKRSFEHLLFRAGKSDYFAFSDQDDVWLPDKLNNAIRVLRQAPADRPALYASSVLLVDERLNEIGRNEFPGFVYSIPSEIIRHRLAGHTMVWNAALQRELLSIGSLPCLSHDQQVTIGCLLCGGDLYLDKATYALHRRLKNSATPGHAGIAKRVAHEWKLMFGNREPSRSDLASEILELDKVTLDNETCAFLDLCVSYRSSIKRRFQFAMLPALDCGIPVGNAEARAAILSGRF